MADVKEALIAVATAEWERWGRSTRDGHDWRIAGEEWEDPHAARVGEYWRAVGQADWDGRTDQPWSAAFISWCFATAGWQGLFDGHDTHSAYVDRIRRGVEGMSPALVLYPPGAVRLKVGDLIWNSRKPDLAGALPAPRSHDEAVARLAAGDFFASHVDIVVSVEGDRCASIGGNVSNVDPGGSVTRSTWPLKDGTIDVPHVEAAKAWIGVVANGV